MNPNILIAAIAASGSIIIAVTGLLLNWSKISAIREDIRELRTDMKRLTGKVCEMMK
jgi:hypothetical protein